MILKKYKIEYENGIIQEKYLIPKNVEFFTENSPMGEAINTGILKLPVQQGGNHKIKITPIT